jgi:hypothetical protein
MEGSRGRWRGSRCWGGTGLEPALSEVEGTRSGGPKGRGFRMGKVTKNGQMDLELRRTFDSGLYSTAMFKKLMLYGLPVYLYGLELLLKAFAAIKADSVAGPTLAGAGLGFLLPLTELKSVTVDSEVRQKLEETKTAIYSRTDKSFSDFVWVCFFSSLILWMWCIYLTLHPSQEASYVNKSFAIGCIIFVGSVVLTEIKERI